jgi:hypothetical protein
VAIYRTQSLYYKERTGYVLGNTGKETRRHVVGTIPVYMDSKASSRQGTFACSMRGVEACDCFSSERDVRTEVGNKLLVTARKKLLITHKNALIMVAQVVELKLRSPTVLPLL